MSDMRLAAVADRERTRLGMNWKWLYDWLDDLWDDRSPETLSKQCAANPTEDQLEAAVRGDNRNDA